jgi:hypothetical protein
MRDARSILADRVLLDLIERLDDVRGILEQADGSELAHLQVLADNALREAANYLARLREERLGL